MFESLLRNLIVLSDIHTSVMPGSPGCVQATTDSDGIYGVKITIERRLFM